jgi:hypothetical protein
LKRIITDDGSVAVQEKGVHAYDDVVKKRQRGFASIINDDIVADLNSGKSPKRITLNHCSEPTHSQEFKKSKKAIANLKYRLKKKADSIHGMHYLHDIRAFIDANIFT